MNSTMHREAPVTFGLKHEEDRANFIFGRGFDLDFFIGNFQRKKKKKRILSVLEPMLIPSMDQHNYH